MIICICKNVNSRQLNECLQRGMSIDDISTEMGLGTGCGKCLEYALNVVNSAALNGTQLIAREAPAA